MRERWKGRILPHLVASGPTQMALDEALLESVCAEPTAAVIRTYAWSEPTLSLGYFQEFSATADPRWQGAAVVRRATGGGAIWHEHEITYTVVVPRAHRLGARAVDLYQGVHAAIAAMLQKAGALARRRGDDPDRPDRPFLCFQDRDPEDLVVGRCKVVGSAQRRWHAAVLQHGSILLARADARRNCRACANWRISIRPLRPGSSRSAGHCSRRLAWRRISSKSRRRSAPGPSRSSGNAIAAPPGINAAELAAASNGKTGLDLCASGRNRSGPCSLRVQMDYDGATERTGRRPRPRPSIVVVLTFGSARLTASRPRP